MTKKLFSILFTVTVYGISFSQVGINTADPKATLDITAKTTDASKPEGFIAPRLTGDQIRGKNALYDTSQTGTIIYATTADSSPAGKTTNINVPGYYYFDGSAWQKITTGAGGGSTGAWVNDNSNAMIKLGMQSNGSTARVTGAEFVALDNGNVGIGTTTPDASAKLDLTSSNKGFLPPRMTLTDPTDAVTISNPASGLVVYHNGNTDMIKGLYSNNGTPASPLWEKVGSTSSASQGSVVYKTVYRGRNTTPFTKPELNIPEMNLKMRFAEVSGTMYLQVRLLNTPSTTVNVRVNGHWQGQSHSSNLETHTFTSTNYSTWQNIWGSWSGEWGYYYLFYTDESRTGIYNPLDHVMNLYGICGYGTFGAAAKEPYSLAGEVF